MNCLTGFFYLGSILVLAASPLDDKARAFEDALHATPGTKAPAASVRFGGPTATSAELDAMLQRGDQQAGIEAVVSQLMASHPSTRVQQAGKDFLTALEADRNQKSRDFTARATTILADAKTAVTQARKASDLDKVLDELRGAAGPQDESFVVDASSQELSMRLNLAAQFVALWQDYLSASVNGKTEEARQSLSQLLNNTQLDALGYFPRSELLARRDGNPSAAGTAPPTTDVGDEVDGFLKKIKVANDVSAALNAIDLIPNQPVDLSPIVKLEQERDDQIGGLPITLDLKGALGGTYFGDQISRVTAIELLAILPSYFGTESSDPPKPDEKLSDYLDRLAASADASGNLAVLQRVLAVQDALTRDRNSQFGAPTAVFLAGLSQEAAGQFAPAVVSYENALKESDFMLPVKIVGHRLAAIKAAHPDEYNEGVTTFLTPAPQPDPRYPIGWPPNQFAQQNAQRNLGNALPIPLYLPIPGRADSHAAPAPAASPASK